MCGQQRARPVSRQVRNTGLVFEHLLPLFGLFQKANLRPKLVCTKFFTDELKLCWPPATQL
jgi:hypothetical protein